MDRYGNTSAASIPIALDEAVRDGRVKDGQLVMFEHSARAHLGLGIGALVATTGWVERQARRVPASPVQLFPLTLSMVSTIPYAAGQLQESDFCFPGQGRSRWAWDADSMTRSRP